MKLVFQNPHWTAETRTSRIHDYTVELLRQRRPAVKITPWTEFARWFRFLLRKDLPLLGWDYVLSDSELRRFDAWVTFCGTHPGQLAAIPREFGGVKFYHVMDYSFWPDEAASAFAERRVDYLLGYARHDLWCPFFQHAFPGVQGRVLPVPFGYSDRFTCHTPFHTRVPKASIMGAVVPLEKPEAGNPSLAKYYRFFEEIDCAHWTRWNVRRNLDRLESRVANFLPDEGGTRNFAYNSAVEIERHQLFINDASCMHYPPARTYEGMATGSVMLAERIPVYQEDFGLREGVHCLMHRPHDLEDLEAVLSQALIQRDRLTVLHGNAVRRMSHFSHEMIGNYLFNQLEAAFRGDLGTATNFWATSAFDQPDQAASSRSLC